MKQETGTRTAGVTVKVDGRGQLTELITDCRTLGRLAATEQASNVLRVGFLPTTFTNQDRTYHHAVVHLRLCGQRDAELASNHASDLTPDDFEASLRPMLKQSDADIRSDAALNIERACQAVNPIDMAIADDLSGYIWCDGRKIKHRMRARDVFPACRILPLGEVDPEAAENAKLVTVPYGVIGMALASGKAAFKELHYAQVVGGFVLDENDALVRAEGGVLVGRLSQKDRVGFAVLLSWQHIAIIQEMVGETAAKYRFDRRFRLCPRSFQLQKNIEVVTLFREEILLPLSRALQALCEKMDLVSTPVYEKLRLHAYCDLMKRLRRCRDADEHTKLERELLEMDGDTLPFHLERLLTEPLPTEDQGKAGRIGFYHPLRLSKPISKIINTLLPDLPDPQRVQIASTLYLELCSLIGDTMQAHGENSVLDSFMQQNYDSEFRTDRAPSSG